jgi:hypothetical protein
MAEDKKMTEVIEEMKRVPRKAGLREDDVRLPASQLCKR